jgi:Xaa-Pro aminopeptidase
MNYERRLQQIQAELPAQKVDYLLVTHLPNIRYLCGFTGSAGVLVITETSSTFFTDGRYTSQAKDEVTAARVVVGKKAPVLAAAEWIARATRGRKRLVGIEGESMTVAGERRLGAVLGRSVRLRQAPNLIERMRMIKDADELAHIRKAVLLGAGLFDTVLKTVHRGVHETEVAAKMEFEARQAGADGMSFETIIAGGKRSALPHGRASQQPVPATGFVVCDFGVILTGYCSDMTRTLYVGRASREARAFYEAVREAQLAGISAVGPGVAVGEVDRAARNVLKRAGLGRYFSHSTGHGVGLEIHEPPRVAAGQSEVLQPGMVITIEPGAYIPGKWGVRIEDMVVVTESGCEVLTPTTKELIAV